MFVHSQLQQLKLCFSIFAEMFSARTYTPDLAPSDFNLFGGVHFQDDDKLKEVVTELFTILAAGVCNERIDKNGITLHGMTSV